MTYSVRLIFMLAVGALCVSSVQADAPELRGDPRAVAAVERMLQRLGGREAWADARSLYLDYRVWRTDPDEALSERAWRDLQAPNQRIELDSPSAPVTWVFTPTSGWVMRGGEVRTLSDAGHASAVAFWPFDFYTMLHRFAVGDQELVLSFAASRRVVVRSTAGADWGWWEIDAHGNLLKWGAISDGETLEYVYGPVKPFGAVSFPAWGAAVNGSWRFEYASIAASREPIPAAKLAQPK